MVPSLGVGAALPVGAGVGGVPVVAEPQEGEAVVVGEDDVARPVVVTAAGVLQERQIGVVAGDVGPVRAAVEAERRRGRRGCECRGGGVQESGARRGELLDGGRQLVGRLRRVDEDEGAPVDGDPIRPGEDGACGVDEGLRVAGVAGRGRHGARRRGGAELQARPGGLIHLRWGERPGERHGDHVSVRLPLRAPVAERGELRAVGGAAEDLVVDIALEPQAERRHVEPVGDPDRRRGDEGPAATGELLDVQVPPDPPDGASGGNQRDDGDEDPGDLGHGVIVAGGGVRGRRASRGRLRSSSYAAASAYMHR